MSSKITSTRMNEIRKELEEQFHVACVLEYKFLRGRNYRTDIAFPCCKLALEIEGGAYSGGRHTQGAGFVKDIQKYNLYTLNGWKLLRFTVTEVRNSTFTHQVGIFFSKYPCSHNLHTPEKLPFDSNFDNWDAIVKPLKFLKTN